MTTLNGERRPDIALVVAGGTISTTGSSSLDLAAYRETGARVSATDLVDEVPDLESVAAVKPVEFRRVSSTAITAADWIELRELVASLREGYDGVVVAHGTDTLEETAYFLDLCLAPGRPVVLVGAMRPLSALSSDAHLNLVRAVQVAGSADAAGQGVLVVINEQVFLARDVAKTSGQRVDGFGAPNSGPIGIVDPAGDVVMDRKRSRTGPQFDVVGDLPRVDVVMSHVGADGVLIDAAVAAGARGIVSAGAGAGRPTPLEEQALDRATRSGVVVCRSSRVPSATVVPTQQTAGYVAARGLSPWKARILLALALTRTRDAREIQRLFDEA